MNNTHTNEDNMTADKTPATKLREGMVVQVGKYRKPRIITAIDKAAKRFSYVSEGGSHVGDEAMTATFVYAEDIDDYKADRKTKQDEARKTKAATGKPKRKTKAATKRTKVVPEATDSDIDAITAKREALELLIAAKREAIELGIEV